MPQLPLYCSGDLQQLYRRQTKPQLQPLMPTNKAATDAATINKGRRICLCWLWQTKLQHEQLRDRQQTRQTKPLLQWNLRQFHNRI